jgi:hypothetical protein
LKRLVVCQALESEPLADRVPEVRVVQTPQQLSFTRTETAEKLIEDDDEGGKHSPGACRKAASFGPADDEILRYDNANDAHGVGRHHHYHWVTHRAITESTLAHSV